MEITYNKQSNTILVTGGSAENPVTFDDILDANNSNEWDVFSSPEEGKYVSTARIEVGDGTILTYFASSDREVQFNYNFLSVKEHAYYVIDKLGGE